MCVRVSLEVAEGDVGPEVTAGIEEYSVVAACGVEELGDKVVRFNLCRVGAVLQAQALLHKGSGESNPINLSRYARGGVRLRGSMEEAGGCIAFVITLGYATMCALKLPTAPLNLPRMSTLDTAALWRPRR